ncbi:MAG: TonB-dependent receptor [bacterium]|nr:TonB-dependent receptor [bacterium]
MERNRKTRRYAAPLFAALAIWIPLRVNAGTLRGMIHDQDTGDVLVGASAVLDGTQRGAATNPKGIFTISQLAAGRYVLKISMLGYESLETEAVIGETDTVMMHLALAPSAIEGDEVTIEAERAKSGLDNTSTVRKEVITGADLQTKSKDGGLLSALQNKTGLRTKPCALCGAAGIGMQGLDPSYTEINVDGLPVLSGLGTLYGLDGLSVSDVKEVQVTKGSGSSLFGSGAIAGAVNLVSSRPALKPTLLTNISLDNNGKSTISASASGLTGRLPMRLSLMNSAEPQYVDTDDDGLTDTPKYRRFNLNYAMDPRLKSGILKLGARLFTEHRYAGETNWHTGRRGGTAVYGRDILTDRGEVSGKYEFPLAGKFKGGLESALVRHEQESWYGATSYNATQELYLAKASARGEWNKNHASVFELLFNHQDYRDNLILPVETDLLYNTPGATVEHTVHLDDADRLTVQGGTKIEYWEAYGVEVIPRGSLLFKPNVATGFRLSGGAGFRPVSIFSLEEAAHAGFEKVIVPASLAPERSTAGSFAVNRQWMKSRFAVNADVSLFYTHFDDKVVLRYGSHHGETVYANSPEAYSVGSEVQTGLSLTSGWSVDLGGRVSKVRYDDGAGTFRNAEFQSVYSGNAGVSKQFRSTGVTAELNVGLFGPQYLPEGRGRDKSPAFAIWSGGLTKSWKNLSLSASVNNLFDWTQPDDPYLRDETGRLLLDSSLIYGPQLGRTVAVALTWRHTS